MEPNLCPVIKNTNLNLLNNKKQNIISKFGNLNFFLFGDSNFLLYIYNKIIKMKDIIRMQQLAGIITEGQARKMMTILGEGSANLGALDILPGVEKYVPFYLQKLRQSLTDMTPKEYFKQNIQGATGGDEDDALSLAKQSGTWDDYSDEELAKIDLGLMFNTYYFKPGTEITKSDVNDHILDSLDTMEFNS
jgi:hypothetical protein